MVRYVVEDDIVTDFDASKLYTVGSVQANQKGAALSTSANNGLLGTHITSSTISVEGLLNDFNNGDKNYRYVLPEDVFNSLITESPNESLLYNTIEIVTKNGHELAVKSFMKRKKNSLTPLTNAVNALASTSNTRTGSNSSNPTLSNGNGNVKQHSIGLESDLRPDGSRKDLRAVHNLSEDNLRKTLELGGMVMPSIAVSKDNIAHEGFGDISVVFNKDTIDPANKDNPVYKRDAYTPTFPQPQGLF